jgi:hypothetical protein
MDTFIERLVTKKRTSKDTLTSIGIVIAAIVLSVIILFIPIINSFAPVLIVAIIYFAYIFMKSTNLEFEYSVTNGDIDVDKIIAKRKRKRIFSAVTKDIEIIAKLKSDKYSSEYKNIRNKIEAVTTMESNDLYFIVAPYKGEKTIIFFEPDQRMIDAFKSRIPRKVFEY